MKIDRHIEPYPVFPDSDFGPDRDGSFGLSLRSCRRSHGKLAEKDKYLYDQGHEEPV